MESSCISRWAGHTGRGRRGAQHSSSTLDWSAGVWGAALAELVVGGEYGWVMKFAPLGSHSCLGHCRPPSAQQPARPFSLSLFLHLFQFCVTVQHTTPTGAV